MTDDFRLRNDAAKGEKAQSLLDSEVLTGIFEALEAEYVKYWREHTALNDVQGRERLWQAVHILGTVRSHLSTIAGNGKVARAELNRLAQGSHQTNG